MNLKTFCLFFFLISFLAFSPEVMAEEGTSSDDALSPSTIFDPEPYFTIKPRNNLGIMLKTDGFKLQSMEEEENVFSVVFPLVDMEQYFPSYVKTFTKGGYTVRYRYAIYDTSYGKDEVAFDWVEIQFPSKTNMNEFLDSVKASIKSNCHEIFTHPEDPNCFLIGIDDSEIKTGFLYAYDKIKIKGNTLIFQETENTKPYACFINPREL